MIKEGRKRPQLREDENHARVDRVWSAMELRLERKERRKERMSRWFMVIKYRRIRACVAPKSCRRHSHVRNSRRCSMEKEKKKRKMRERGGDKESNRECAHVTEGKERDSGERRKSYLHQDSARFSSYHTESGRSFRC